MTGKSLTELRWCEHCQITHAMPQGECHIDPSTEAWGRNGRSGTTRYASLVRRLCGQAVQLEAPVPVRAYTGRPVKPRTGELALWTQDRQAWAAFGDVKTLVSAFEVIELLAMSGGTCVLELDHDGLR